MSATRTLGRSWLVQRLNKPQPRHPILGDNPFAFGGGLVNGGLSKDAMALLRPIFSFDYMGSAEFEFGAVPKALNKMAQVRLEAHSLTVDLSTVPAGWGRKSAEPATGEATLYVLSIFGLADVIVERVREWAAGNERLKESTQLPAALRPVEDWDSRLIGWLELDNGFFVFTDETAWSMTCDLFGVTR